MDEGRLEPYFGRARGSCSSMPGIMGENPTSAPPSALGVASKCIGAAKLRSLLACMGLTKVRCPDLKAWSTDMMSACMALAKRPTGLPGLCGVRIQQHMQGVSGSSSTWRPQGSHRSGRMDRRFDSIKRGTHVRWSQSGRRGENPPPPAPAPQRRACGARGMTHPASIRLPRV